MSYFIQARTNESLKVPQLDIAVPMNLKDKNKKTGQDETSQNNLNTAGTKHATFYAVAHVHLCYMWQMSVCSAL